MSTRRLSTFAALVVAATGAVGAVSASAATASAATANIPTRTFDVSLEGEQMTTFSSSHSKQSQCDQASHGSGYERVRFHSIGSRHAIEARRVGNGIVMFGTGRPSSDELDIRATVTRHSRVFTQSLDPRCDGTGGSTTPPPAPDCGTKRSIFSVALGWAPLGRNAGIRLDDSLFVPLPLFRNCGVTGTTFPTLLAATTSGRQIVAHIPAADLFDPGFRKHIVLASGRFVSNTNAGGFQSGYTTWIRWTVSLTEHRN
jgi:hypothetical protein